MIVLDAVATKAQMNARVYTWAHTCTGTDLILIVELCWIPQDSGRWVASITYNGVALTREVGANDDLSQLWYLIAPATGAHDIVVTNAGAGDRFAKLAAGSVSYTDVNQDDPVRNSVIQTGSGTSITGEIPSAQGDMVVDAIGVDTNGVGLSLITAGHQVERWNVEVDDTCEGAGSDQPGDHMVAMGWVTANAASLHLCIMSLQRVIVVTDKPVAYFTDVWDPEQRILDSEGRVVPRHKIKPNNWCRIVGLESLSADVYESHADDPSMMYFESVKYDGETDTVEIITNRGDLPENIIAKLMSGPTM